MKQTKTQNRSNETSLFLKKKQHLRKIAIKKKKGKEILNAGKAMEKLGPCVLLGGCSITVHPQKSTVKHSLTKGAGRI